MMKKKNDSSGTESVNKPRLHADVLQILQQGMVDGFTKDNLLLDSK